ncbi:MAG: DNA-processing protein DprA [Lachnospiraceae bacterium]|nr:DNA-processing protein DprA [Lachnospiraceae bacterium]
MTERESLMALSRISYAGMPILHKIVDFTDGARGFFCSTRERIEKMCSLLKINDHIKATLLEVHKNPDIPGILALMEKEELRFITEEDNEYPEKLKEIFSPPLYLYVRGDLNKCEKSVAIIGSRNCSFYGREVAVSFGKIFASNGINVVSGMAKGVDGYAHIGALEGEGHTTAVLGFGHCECYPAEHRTLKNRIEKSGCLISEYHPLVRSDRLHFPARNRLIAALADCLVVVEAAIKSGTIITVDFALSLGRNIYAVPGRIGDPLSEGCIELIKHGCRPVTDPGEVLSDLGYFVKKSVSKKIKNPLDLKQKIVYSNVDLIPRTTEEILSGTGLETTEGLRALFTLELNGFIKQPVTGTYIRNVEDYYG